MLTDQSSGTHFQTNWETTLNTVVLGSHWKHCFSASTSVTSALKVYLYTTMWYINRQFTYLLTYNFDKWSDGFPFLSKSSTVPSRFLTCFLTSYPGDRFSKNLKTIGRFLLQYTLILRQIYHITTIVRTLLTL